MHLSFPDDVAPFKSHCSAPNSLFRFSKFHNTNLSLIFTIQWMIHALVSALLLSVLFTSIVLCPVELPQNICRRSKCWAIRSHRGSADNIRHYPLFASVIVYPTCCDTLKREPMQWVNYSDHWIARQCQDNLKVSKLCIVTITGGFSSQHCVK